MRGVNKKFISCTTGLFFLAVWLFLAAGLVTPIQAQTPSGHWTFDDGSGTMAADSSSNRRAASLANGVSWIPGQIGGAVSAKPVQQQYVSIPRLDLSSTHAVTISLWANRTYTTSGGHALFEATGDYTNSTTGFGFFPDDDTCHGIQVALRGDVGYTANCYSQPSSGVWHHLAVVLDKSRTGGNEVQFYADGVLQPVSWNLRASTNTNNFGSEPIYLFSRAGATQFDSGAIDDLRIYDQALTAAQIRQIYNSAILVSLAVTPSNPLMSKGEQQQFIATGTYKDGSKKDLSTAVTWTLSAPSVAGVTHSGLATALAAGNTSIKATLGSTFGTANLIISFHVLVSIAVTPANASLAIGQQQQFTATGTYSDGSQQNLTNSATWASSATSVATVSSGGLSTAIAAGSATIQAAAGSIKGSASLTVTPPTLVSIAVTPTNPSLTVGQQQQFTATGTYSDGSQQNLTNTATWSSSSTSVATINSTGGATALAAGNTNIRAVAGSISASTSLTVTGGPIWLDGTSHGVHDNGSIPSTTAVLLIGTPSAADLITCEVSLSSAGGNTFVSVADNQNGPYAAAAPVHLNATLGKWYGIYFKENVAGTPTTITLTTSQLQPYSAISCQAWKGVAASNSVDPGFPQLQDAVAIANPTTGAINRPAVNGELILAAVGLGNSGTPTSGANYTLLDGASATLWWPEYWPQTTATATAGNYIWPSDTFTDTMVGFRPSTAPPLVSLAVTPANPSIAAGQQQQFTATGTYSDGSHADFTKFATWSSSFNSVATVSGGLATGVAVGSTTIQATSGSISGSTTLTVTAATLVSIAVTPANPTIAAGQQQQFTATGTYTDGSHQNLTGTATWTSTSTSVATVSSGLATGVAAGSTTIQATSGSISGSTNLTVTAAALLSIAVTPANASIAAGLQQQFTATGTYTDGSHQNLTATASWTSSAPAVATVSGGLAAGVAVGSTTIQATSGSISGSTSLTVTAAALVSIAVTPANPSIAAGQQQQFNATGTYTDGSHQNLTNTATWTSSAPAVATVSGGLAAGVAVGSTTIQATSGSISGSTSLTVTAAALVSIAVTPANPSVAAGQQQQFTAAGTYTDGSHQNLTGTATWTSTSTAVATVSAGGLASAIAAGTTSIKATSGSISGSTSLTVTAAALVSIAVTPANPSIAAGQQQQFTATGTYTDGSHQNLTGSASWISSAPSIATVSLGLATGVAAGSTAIQATSGSVTGSASLTVTAATLVSIAVTPASASIAAGQQQQFTATATYTDGSHQNLTAAASWTSSAPSVATVSAGLATGLATGSTTIQATSGSVTGSASLSVTAATLVSIAVTPASASIAPGQQQQFIATGTYTDGSHQNLTATATWTSSATSVATVSAGLATGVAAGSTTIQATSGSVAGSASLSVTGQPFIALAWTASTSPGVVGYNAYRSLTTNGPYTKLNSNLIATTSYNDQTVQIGITYYYVTTAVNSQGLESAYSNQAAATVP